MLTDTITNPYYNKKHGVTIGFILSVLFCSKIESTEKQIIYIFYFSNIIPHDFLKFNRNDINASFLLKLIFHRTDNKKYISKKEVRQLTGLNTRDTFNKYFNPFLKEQNLSGTRVFTFPELFKILQYWQGDDKWIRMEAYSKKELADKLYNGNYDKLEEAMTDKVFDIDYNYKNRDFKSPLDVKKLARNALDEKSQQSFFELEEENAIDYLSFFYYLYLFYTIKRFKPKKPNKYSF